MWRSGWGGVGCIVIVIVSYSSVVVLVYCLQVNARHYRRDVEDGVPRRTPWELETGLKEQFAIRRKEVPRDPVCM